MHGDELRPVRESRLHLNVVQHLGHTVHHVVASEYLTPRCHEFGDAASVPCTLEHVIGDQRDGLGVIQLHAPALPAPGQFRCVGDEQPFLFMWRQPHLNPSSRRCGVDTPHCWCGHTATRAARRRVEAPSLVD
ncbi:Uncharacterised protein [Mycobacteroides abscessus subsp. abscessus]|nr:Uncharacterised protein [Mycobacteroides abscessus subsp. abscessus]